MNEENQKRLEAAAGNGNGTGGFKISYAECDDGWVKLLETLFKVLHHRLSRWREVKEIESKIQKQIDTGVGPYLDTKMPDWIPAYFAKHPTDPMLEFSVEQIKEKFGGARIYCSLPEDDELRCVIDGAIALAEALSYTVCESCGLPGKVGGKGWLKTLCDGCRKETV